MGATNTCITFTIILFYHRFINTMILSIEFYYDDHQTSNHVDFYFYGYVSVSMKNKASKAHIGPLAASQCSITDYSLGVKNIYRDIILRRFE